MSMESAHEMFIHELGDVRDAEMKLVSQLQKMAKKVSDETLRQLFEQHREETEGQIERLEQIYEELEEKPKRQPCKGMSGLIDEFQTFVKEEKPEDELLDVYACSAAIKVEHYEISSYESLISMAHKLGLEEAAKLLEQTLEEEKNTLQKLQEAGQELLAQLPVEEEMMEEGEEEEEEEEEEVATPRKGRKS
ncbi:MAG TPA: DUF892 family protein [Planctomycetota bacterium]|nr:DUF892 family protein [Planctomycetota bacterium]